MALDEVIFERRGVDHEDERRTLLTAFNGDLGGFLARSVGYTFTDKSENYINYVPTMADGNNNRLLFLLDGLAEIKVGKSGESESSYSLSRGSRLFIPSGHQYSGRLSGCSVLVECSEGHVRERERDFFWLPLPEDFAAAQVKFAKMRKEAVLGGHYHPDYREFFYMMRGRATFTLGDLDSEKTEEHHLAPGEDGLLVLPRVPHKGNVSEFGILVGCTEKPYISPQVNDVRHDF